MICTLVDIVNDLFLERKKADCISYEIYLTFLHHVYERFCNRIKTGVWTKVIYRKKVICNIHIEQQWDKTKSSI